MGWLRQHLKLPSSSQHGTADLPPGWAPAEEASRADGLLSDAPEWSYQDGKAWCAANTVESARFVASRDVERVGEVGRAAWEVVVPAYYERFVQVEDVVNYGAGKKGAKVVRITTGEGCGDVSLLSNLPVVAGMYDVGRGKEGVYYEVEVEEMQGCIAVGAACRPYPPFRLPGWERLSAALHLDDASKFFEDPDGGRPYCPSQLPVPIPAGSVIGFGYEFASSSVFFTYNGVRLDDAFRGVFLPRHALDVYVCIGVSGPGRNKLLVNFGADPDGKPFAWKPGREWAWSLDGLFGTANTSSSSGSVGPRMGEEGEESLPAYRDVV